MIKEEETVINNETMQSILARRSYKVFDSKPIDDEALDTIVTAGLYAPTGMNRQPWHFTVIKSREMLEKFGAARRSLPLPPGIPPEVVKAMGDPMRNAPVMILVSAKEGGTSAQDCCLAMENMFIASSIRCSSRCPSPLRMWLHIRPHSPGRWARPAGSS